MSDASEIESASAEPRPSRANGWFVTAFGLATIIGMLAMALLAGAPDKDMVSQWVRYFGRFHFVILHLPIGMLSLVILLEFGKLFRKDKGSSTLVPIFFTAASAVVAVILGFLLYQSGSDNSKLIQDHMWWSVGFASATVLAFMVKNWVDLAGGKGSFLYFLILLGSAGLMTVSSHDGGESVHGKGYLRKEEPVEVREWINQIPGAKQLPIEDETVEGEESEESEESEGDNAEEDAKIEVVVVPVEEQVVYTLLIQPIFDAKCVSCHGEDKQKGKYRMDTYEAVVSGGKEGDGLEPGDAEDSNIMFRIHLPEDDDERMPPEDEPQMEAYEIAILEWWIDSGASPDAKLSELEVSDEIQEALNKIIAPESIVAEEEPKVETSESEKAARRALEEKVKALQGDFPSAMSFESGVSSGLVFTAESVRETFSDEDLSKLQPIVGGLVSLDLSATKVGDKGVGAIADARKLRMLRLSETEITDTSLDTIDGLIELESLNLSGTGVTTAGVAKLAELPKLKRLYLWRTKVDEAGADELRKKMPECEIVMGL